MTTQRGRSTVMTTDSEMLHREDCDPPADLVAGLAGNQAKPVPYEPEFRVRT